MRKAWLLLFSLDSFGWTGFAQDTPGVNGSTADDSLEQPGPDQVLPEMPTTEAPESPSESPAPDDAEPDAPSVDSDTAVEIPSEDEDADSSQSQGTPEEENGEADVRDADNPAAPRTPDESPESGNVDAGEQASDDGEVAPSAPLPSPGETDMGPICEESLANTSWSDDCKIQSLRRVSLGRAEILSDLCSDSCLSQLRKHVQAAQANCSGVKQTHPRVLRQSQSLVDITAACEKNSGGQYCGIDYVTAVQENGLNSAVDPDEGLPDQYWCSECGFHRLESFRDNDDLIRQWGDEFQTITADSAERFGQIQEEQGCKAKPNIVSITELNGAFRAISSPIAVVLGLVGYILTCL